MAIKKKEGERLDDAHIIKVKEHLENGGSKKDAYDILNIKANPQRLQKIIDEYDKTVEITKLQRKKKAGTPATDFEISTVIQRTLDGDSVKEISEDLYRSTAFVKNVIEHIGVPQKYTGSWYENQLTTSIPDECIRSEFPAGELVWSHRYNGPVIIIKKMEKDTVYQVYVIEKIEEPSPYFSIEGYGGRYAHVDIADLGSLSHLNKWGVDVYKPYRPYFGKWLNEST